MSRCSRQRRALQQRVTVETEPSKDLSSALVAAIARMRNPPRNRSVEVSTRGARNTDSGTPTLDKILDMARPVLAEEGLILFQPITTNDKGALVLTTRLLHRSGEYMETSMPLPAAGADPQTLAPQ